MSNEDAMHPAEKAQIERELGVTLTYNPRSDGWNLSEILTREQLEKLVDVTDDATLVEPYRDGRCYFNVELPDDDGIEYAVELSYDPIQNLLEFI